MGLTQKLGTIPLAIFTDASNNIGIGGSPSGSYKFEVTGTGRFTSDLSVTGGSYFLQRASGSAILPVLRYWNGTGNPMNGGALGDILTIGTQGTNDFVIATDNTRRLTIFSNGLANFANSIGINTTPVSATGTTRTLQVGGSTIIQSVVNNQSIFGDNVYYDGSGWRYATSNNAAAIRIGAANVGEITFHSAPYATAGSSVPNWDSSDIKMRIAPTGAVTISSATYPILSVNTTQSLSAGNFDIWNFLAPNQTGGAISFNIGKALATYNNAALKFYYAGNNSASNSFGIGFYDGDNRLNIRADGLLTATGPTSPFNFDPGGRVMYVNSSGQIGSTSSTRESKIHINPITSVEYIMQLNPVSFYHRIQNTETRTYTDEYYDEIKYGFIADEVEKVNLDLVFYNENEDGTKKLAGVEYMSMIAVLTKAVQELSAKVSALENKS